MADSGAAVLDAQIKKLRELGHINKTIAADVAKAVERELTDQIARGVGPDGKTLVPTKDGRQPLRGAARALRVRSIGTVILATLEGHHALHHRGRARGGIRRPILPSAKIPEPVTKAIKAVATKHFKKTMGAR